MSGQSLSFIARGVANLGRRELCIRNFVRAEARYCDSLAVHLRDRTPLEAGVVLCTPRIVLCICMWLGSIDIPY